MISENTSKWSEKDGFLKIRQLWLFRFADNGLQGKIAMR